MVNILRSIFNIVFSSAASYLLLLIFHFFNSQSLSNISNYAFLYFVYFICVFFLEAIFLLPFLLLMRKRKRVTKISLSILGAVIANMPMIGFLILLSVSENGIGAQSAYTSNNYFPLINGADFSSFIYHVLKNSVIGVFSALSYIWISDRYTPAILN